jgi:hypothetical protein
MACGAPKRFFKVGSYYLREDKIIALIENTPTKNTHDRPSVTITYDSPNLKTITHITDNPQKMISQLSGGWTLTDQQDEGANE